MSDTMSPVKVLFLQRILSCSGFYKGSLDAKWGPVTEQAEKDFIVEFTRIRDLLGTFDTRTEAAIMTLLPKAQDKARQFMKAAGPKCKILSGTRTYAEQDALFAQRPVVTHARGGQSNHNFGIAWDVGIFDGGHYLTGETHAEEASYDSLAAHIKQTVTGLEWGGDWHSIVDKPHYQLATGKTLGEVREAFEAGKPFV